MNMPPKKHLGYFVLGTLCVIICITFYFLASYIPSLMALMQTFYKIVSPFIYGFAIAFILNPLMNFYRYKIFERIKFKKPRNKLKKILSLILTYVTTILLVSVFLIIVTPQIVDSVSNLIANMPQYVSSFNGWLDNFVAQDNVLSNLVSEHLEDIKTTINNVVIATIGNIQQLQSVIDAAMSTISTIFNFFIGIIVSIYVLADKENFKARGKKILYAFFKKERVTEWLYWFNYSSKTFTNYISGKMLDSLIVGLLCFIFMTIFRWDYAILISVIVGVTNMIPFFGPFIGAIPSALILFLINPWISFFFIIFIFVLQQLDGNVIGPLILGDSIGMSAFWVMFSIIVFGGLFGIAGMFLGVPFFAIVYSILKMLLENRLKRKGLPTATENYLKKNAAALENDMSHPKSDKDSQSDSGNKTVTM